MTRLTVVRPGKPGPKPAPDAEKKRRGTYQENRGNPNDTRTFGVKATVVSSTLVPQDMVYAVVKAVFDDLAAFSRQHPALADLQAKEMVHQGLAAPLHQGAARYYQEKNLE